MANISAIDFTVNIKNLQDTRFVEKHYSEDLASNQVLLQIDKFSFTSNNITYAVLGERMNYWRFFPAPTGFGIVPAWGYASVIHSNHPQIEVGQRFYGYYPMSSHLLVTAEKVSEQGFADSTEHRLGLPPIYNFYTNTANDPSYSPELEDLTSLFRPLFVTSFLIDDHFSEQSFHGATEILITSASSKTAQALAFLMAKRIKEQDLNLNIIGLTSSKNAAFVKQLGWYDQVLLYEEIATLDRNEKHMVIDFAGNHETQYQLQMHLEESLQYNCRVGLVDWQHLEGKRTLPNKGEMFFAPNHAQQRQKHWGVKGFLLKVGVAWQQFIIAVKAGVSVKECQSPQELQQLYLEMLNGQVDPKNSNIVSLTKS